MRNALLRAITVCAAAAVLVVAATAAPAALRRMDSFRVERVEVTGLRHLDAAAAVRASGITTASNVFDDPAPWIESLLLHPLVASASVERRVPGTIVLNLRESEPVALARTPELMPIDEHGRVLPASPSADGMDVPVLALYTRVSVSGAAADAETLAAVRFLGIVGRLEPGLLGWISEVGTHGDAIRLVLRTATDAEVLVPAMPTAERLRELHLTLAELATPRLAAAPDSAHARDAGAELSRVRRIDGRFHDQIVVALQRGKN
jgi:hypothetical protein